MEAYTISERKYKLKPQSEAYSPVIIKAKQIEAYSAVAARRLDYNSIKYAEKEAIQYDTMFSTTYSEKM